MLTNRHNLPTPLVNAILNDPYNAGESDISVTRLIQPPQIKWLLRGREVTEDAVDRIWALLGQVMHTILERANPGTAVVEKRLFTKVRGWVVSGQFDVLEGNVLTDYKFTTVYARGGKVEWVNQLNLLYALCRRNDVAIDRAQVIAIFRDWRPREALAHDYPKTQVAVIPVPLWSPEKAEAYLEERVRIHQLDNPPPCTDEERWAQPERWALMQGEQEQWALMQEGRKRAVKVLDEKQDLPLKPGQYWERREGQPGKRAIRLFETKPEITLGRGQYWEHRPGAYRRCEGYCAAAPFCPQLAAEQRQEKAA